MRQLQVFEGLTTLRPLWGTWAWMMDREYVEWYLIRYQVGDLSEQEKISTRQFRSWGNSVDILSSWLSDWINVRWRAVTVDHFGE